MTGDDAFRLDKPERRVDNGFLKCYLAVMSHFKHPKLPEKKVPEFLRGLGLTWVKHS